jgi:hypothetical protein
MSESTPRPLKTPLKTIFLHPPRSGGIHSGGFQTIFLHPFPETIFLHFPETIFLHPPRSGGIIGYLRYGVSISQAGAMCAVVVSKTSCKDGNHRILRGVIAPHPVFFFFAKIMIFLDF